MKNGAKDGKMTLYEDDGSVTNEIWKKNRNVSREKVLDPDEAYFGDGKPFYGCSHAKNYTT